VSKHVYDFLASNERGVSDVIFNDVVGRWFFRTLSDRRLAVKSNSARRNQYVTSLWTSLVSATVAPTTTTHLRVSFRYVLRSLAIDRNPVFAAAIFHKRRCPPSVRGDACWLWIPRADERAVSVSSFCLFLPLRIVVTIHLHDFLATSRRTYCRQLSVRYTAMYSRPLLMFPSWTIVI